MLLYFIRKIIEVYFPNENWQQDYIFNKEKQGLLQVLQLTDIIINNTIKICKTLVKYDKKKQCCTCK